MSEPNEAYAYFSLQGVDLDPDAINREVGITPTETWRRGDQNPQTLRERNCGRWKLQSRLPRLAELEAHIADVLLQLEANPEAFQRLAVAHQGCMQLVGYFHSYYPGLQFTADTVQRLARLALCIDCDFYYLHSAEREDAE